jgi:D-glycero-alpha-D-manno-heptose-7-phosphate kinase|tara:strand:- start:868 stop:1728 length:861 start_codon:yes stop_codon:yes gene_type:complete
MVAHTEVKVPVRVDLAGGWTDVKPYCTDFGGEVVNFTINKYVTAKFGESGDVAYEFDIPANSGLGTSGSLNVARITLLDENNDMSSDEIAEAAYQEEISSGNRCGRQDQWAAAHGGFNRFMFHGENVEITPFQPARSAIKWIRKHMLIAHTGISRKSGDLQEKIWNKYELGDKEVTEGLHQIRHATRKIVDALQRDQRQLFVESLNAVSSGVDLIDASINAPFVSIIDPLIENGSVMAWKALGAGAGGCAAVLCHPISIKDVRQKLTESGWQLIDWDYDTTGIQRK